MEILFVEPKFFEKVWGGTRLKEWFNFNIDGEKVGECWGISANSIHDCKIKSGIYKGKSLLELWNNKREIFGAYDMDYFPILIKFIDAHEDLSIQVHPDDQYAIINEGLKCGKSECWYVIDCEKDSTAIIGHKPMTNKDLCYYIVNGNWEKVINYTPISKGGVYQIDAGCIHAIKKNTFILEVQQNIDLTYRLYDYDRKENRKIDLNNGIAAIHNPYKYNKTFPQMYLYNGYNKIEYIKTCNYALSKLEINKNCHLRQMDTFIIFIVIDGNGKINDYNISKGDHLIISSGKEEFYIEGQLSIIQVHIPIL